MKKLSLFLSVFILSFIFIGTVAFADETNVYDYCENEDGTVTITGYKANDINIIIPETVDTYKVTAIGDNAFSGMLRVEKVTINADITSIGVSAFYGCTSLKEIEIPDTVTTIGEYAFGNCPRLDNLKLPDDVKIAENAFHDREESDVTDSKPTNDNTYDPSGFIMIVLILVFAIAVCIACVWMFIKSKRNK